MHDRIEIWHRWGLQQLDFLLAMGLVEAGMGSPLAAAVLGEPESRGLPGAAGELHRLGFRGESGPLPESDEEAILKNSAHGGGDGQPGTGCGAARQTGDAEAIGFAGAFHHPGSCWDPTTSSMVMGSV